MNKKIQIVFSSLFLIAAINSSFSQPQTEWVQRFNSPENYNDYVTDMAVDNLGNVYLTGYIHVSDLDQNYVTIKYNAQGIEQWVRYYDGPDHREDRAGFIAVDDSGNVIVAGSSYSLARSYDYVTIKYNSMGDSLWVRRHDNGLIASAMGLDNQGNVYVTGGTIVDDILTIKYDNHGNLKWEKYYNGVANGYDVSHGLTVDKNNIIYVIGGITGKGGILVKYDSAGNQLSPMIFPNFTPNRKILLDSNLNIHLGFDWYGGLATRYDIAVAKVDSIGIVNWIRTYHNNSTNNNDYFRDMCLDRFGNVTVTGVSGDSGQLAWDIATIKYNTNGDTLWINRYNPAHNSNDEPSSVTSDKFGNSFVTGTSDSGLFAKMITIKYSSSGVREWIAYYNNGNPFTSHSGAKIFADTSGNLYVTGRSQSNQGNIDIVTIKYSLLTNLSASSNLIPTQFILYQNYPNPFNPVTTIKFNLPVDIFVSIKIYDVLGREIKELVNEFKTAGRYNVTFDGSNLPSGIYYYKIKAGNYEQVRKMMLIK